MKITAPVFLHYSGNDWIASDIDVKRAATAIGKNAQLCKVPYQKFNHMDFVWARDAKKFLYDSVLKIIKAN